MESNSNSNLGGLKPEQTSSAPLKTESEAKWDGLDLSATRSLAKSIMKFFVGGALEPRGISKNAFASVPEVVLNIKCRPKSELGGRLPTQFPIHIGNQSFDIPVESSTESSTETSTETSTECAAWRDTDDIEYIQLPPKISPNGHVYTVFRINKTPNATIQIGTQTFKCHLILLKFYSQWFQVNDNASLTYTLEPHEVSPNGFKAAYNWMRHRASIVKPKTLVRVLQVAVNLRIDELIEYCLKVLSADNFKEKSAFSLYHKMRRYPELDNYGQLMLERVRIVFLQYVGHSKFYKLPVDDLCALLDSNDIGVNTEIEIFFTAIHWLNYDYPTNAVHLMKLMGCVRFGNLPITFLTALLGGFRHPFDDSVFENIPIYCRFFTSDACRQMIISAVSFFPLMCTYIGNYECPEFLELCNNPYMKNFTPRNWMYDPQCQYHNLTPSFPYLCDLTYIEFLKYCSDRRRYKEEQINAIQVI